MSTAPPGPDFPPLAAGELVPFRATASSLRWLGGALVVAAVCLALQAVGGYDTPRPVNFDLLLAAAFAGVAAVVVLRTAAALGRAVAGGGDKASLVDAMTGIRVLVGVATLFGVIVAVGLTARTVRFFAHIARGEYGWVDRPAAP